MGEETKEAVVPLQAYRVACLFAAVLGIGAALYFWLGEDRPDMGVLFVVVTLLLLPAYLLYAWAVRRRR